MIGGVEGDLPAEDSAHVGSPQFDRSFHENYAKVLGFALRRVADRGEAEDVVAETFAVAWRRRAEVPDPRLPWLYGVATNLISNQQRSTKRRLRLRRKLKAEPIVVARDPADVADERSAIAVAFARISSGQREVLRLVAWEGLNADEAAEVLGCSKGALGVRLHRARVALAKELEAAGHEQPGGPVHPPRPDPQEAE